MLRKGKEIVAVALLGFLLAAMFGVQPARACVGRKLVIGYKAFTEQAILAELLAILIEERTGTKVSLKEIEDTMEAHRALENNEIQIYVEYTGVGLKEILGGTTETDPQKVYKTVYTAYKKNFNLIWLKTFGFSSKNKQYQEEIKAGLPLFAAPVVRKDTLKKFPALARLINKLNGKIDNGTMDQLVLQVESEGKVVREVAAKFLNKLGITFTFIPGQA